MNKKILSLLMALCLILGSAVAFAADTTTTPDTSPTILDLDENTTYNDTATFDVTATIDDAGVTEDTIYNVELIWGDMAFGWGKYGATKTWDPETHTYEEDNSNETTGWHLVNESTPLEVMGTGSDAVIEGKQGDIFIFNHSNDEVEVNVGIQDLTGYLYGTKLTDVTGGIAPTEGDGIANASLTYTFDRGIADGTVIDSTAGSLDDYKLTGDEAVYNVRTLDDAVVANTTDPVGMNTWTQISVLPTVDYITDGSTTPNSGTLTAGTNTPIATITVTIKQPAASN